ncbi:ABC transporter ATP-binding protein [Catenisphaera adipataccumulans]|jgi:ATP-binding cassette subfamily B multidrug efflux pump|uniref:ABC-type multidrug transport system fused ATPase/permease subunit n=1 Tax=Catenisphaera adipataccumulans TaxID=700500 RepID=A0A7W8D0V4_9FIRM|nr:ABC transporter ATP-binding protein [Catenisphaera adipataccumulans]MBB5183485.1 ABC-type multidrug transport system fused ATPase/permease subunit [Catenisphaera adipataccumulans]
MNILRSYVRKYKKESIIAPAFKMLEAFFDLLVPLVVADCIDVGIAGNDNSYILRCFGILLGLAAIGLACSIIAQYFAAKSAVGLACDLRQAMFDHIQTLSYTELDELGTDTLITRLTSDINEVQNGWNMALRLLLRSPFIVFGSMIMAFTIDRRCGLIFAAVIPLLAAVIALIMRTCIPMFQKVQEKLDVLLRRTRENLTGVRVLRAFCKEQDEIDAFHARNTALTQMNEKTGRINALMNPLTYAIVNIAAILLIRQGAVQVQLGIIQTGDVVALYNYIAQIIVELIKLASLIVTINRSLACARRVADVLAVQPSMTFGKETDDPQETVLTFDHVSMTYPHAKEPALNDLNFMVKQGQTIGIIGPTGSGKSTLVHLVDRFYDADQGTITMDGKNIRAYQRSSLRQMIGMVPQQAVLFKGTIRDNLKWGNENADDETLWQALSIAQAEDVVRRKAGGLNAEVEQEGRNFSGGQRQRLTIARALVRQPRILILDDSASALDYATDAKLRRALRQLPMTVFVVSQRISGVRDTDQIIVLNDGEQVGLGTHEELLKSCRVYQEIYASQGKGASV